MDQDIRGGAVLPGSPQYRMRRWIYIQGSHRTLWCGGIRNSLTDDFYLLIDYFQAT